MVISTIQYWLTKGPQDMPVKSSWHTVLFKSYIYFLIFWLNSLSIIKSGVLISPSTIVVSVAKSCPALCEPMHCIMTGSPLLLYLHEFAQTHFHWVGDTIQPSHSLLAPSPPALNLSLHHLFFIQFRQYFLHISWDSAFWCMYTLIFLFKLTFYQYSVYIFCLL